MVPNICSVHMGMIRHLLLEFVVWLSDDGHIFPSRELTEKCATCLWKLTNKTRVCTGHVMFNL